MITGEEAALEQDVALSQFLDHEREKKVGPGGWTGKHAGLPGGGRTGVGAVGTAQAVSEPVRQ